jgi:hypothetical protein
MLTLRLSLRLSLKPGGAPEPETPNSVIQVTVAVTVPGMPGPGVDRDIPRMDLDISRVNLSWV